ncbi:ATP-binding protein [Streptomyces sp. NC-S4]
MDATPHTEAAPSPTVPPQPITRTRAKTHCTRWLPHCPESASTARRIASTVLHAWNVDDDTIDHALLVVSELVTNALEHALPPVTLHLQQTEHDGTLRIEVDDGGPTDNEGTWTTSCAPEEHGRGVAIITLLASAHGTRILAHTVTYWAILPAAK